MKRLLVLTSACALGTFLAGTPVQGQFLSFDSGEAGFYWRADAGAAIPEDGHLTHLGGFPSGQTVEYDPGVALDLAGGYSFNRYFSTELQVGGTWHYINSIEGAYSDDSSFGTIPILGNIVLQLPIPETRLVPYLGVGAGGAATFFDTDELFFRTPGGSFSLHGGDSDFVFAWQAKGGLRFDLNEKMSLGLGYRYLYTDDSSYSYDSAFRRGPDFKLGLSSHHSHTVALTFQMRF
jgi:opacity protein-like surface antigen